MRTKILMVYRDNNNPKKLKDFLEDNGMIVDLVYNNEEAIKSVLINKYDLILLEIIPTDNNVWMFCKEIRSITTCLIIYIGYIDEVQYILNALDSGADDYLIEPLNLRLLYTKINAFLRRKNLYAKGNKIDIKLNNYDKVSRIIKSEDKIIKLTSIENAVLNFFINNPERILTIKEIYESVWMKKYPGNKPTVTAIVNKLKRKIEEDYKNPQYIITIREIGYYFNEG
ncbi:TPA: response regulator transcription factor [Clostridioides difficile]|nr:response regulator transcription factor [Clostridioides difficile]HDJ1470940.1 response regulator transcription factor [Clostridioides difficile]